MSETPLVSGNDGGRNPQLEARLESLEASNYSLAADVRALTEVLTLINELQQKQRELGQRGEDTARQLEYVARDTNHRIRRNSRRLNMLGLGLSILIPVVSILVYLVLINHVNDLLNQQARDRLAACRTRNAGTMADAEREEALAKVAAGPERAIHTASAKRIRSTTIDCETLYRRK